MPEQSIPMILAALVIGYLFGSIPTGLIATRLAGLGDVRKIGSGNIGATNVLRTGRKGIALITLLGDVLKATIPVGLIASEVGEFPAMAAALGALLGHMFPVWLKFSGGKGVATYIGALIGLFWPAAFAFVTIWIAVAFLTRISSLSALVASAAIPIVLIGFNLPWLALLFLICTALVWIKHQPNIRRLLAGEESKIGGAKS